MVTVPQFMKSADVLLPHRSAFSLGDAKQQFFSKLEKASFLCRRIAKECGEPETARSMNAIAERIEETIKLARDPASQLKFHGKSGS